MILIGYYVVKFLASGLNQRKCISLECGLQNGTLAVFVATQLWDDIYGANCCICTNYVRYLNYFCSHS